jgi:octaprenyl-diphosphate synthase
VGKPLGIDLKERKVTLPLSRLLKVTRGAEQAALLAILAKDAIDDEDVRAVVGMMREHDVLAYTLGEARRYAEQAHGHLAGLPDQHERDVLAQVTRLVVEREF